MLMVPRCSPAPLLREQLSLFVIAVLPGSPTKLSVGRCYDCRSDACCVELREKGQRRPGLKPAAEGCQTTPSSQLDREGYLFNTDFLCTTQAPSFQRVMMPV
eukprot:283686-Rhodomonas_salina.4